MEKKVPWHQRWRGVNRGIYCHFCQKNAFFGQKMTVFWKVHFKQKLSVAQNTVFKWVKNIFLLFHPKLVFFTRFYLGIGHGHGVLTDSRNNPKCKEVMETLDGAADKNIPIITIIHRMKEEEVSTIKHWGRRFAPSCIEDSRRNNSLLFQMFFSVTYKYDWFVPDCKFPLRLFTTTCLCCVLKNIFSKSISKLFEHTEVEFNTFYFSIVEKNERTKWITVNSMEFVLLSKFYL